MPNPDFIFSEQTKKWKWTTSEEEEEELEELEEKYGKDEED